VPDQRGTIAMDITYKKETTPGILMVLMGGRPRRASIPTLSRAGFL